MGKPLLTIFLLCAMLSWLACDNCNLVDCAPNGDYVELRILRDGKNAVFGPDAFISRDSIRYSTINYSVSDVFIPIFINSTETIRLFIEEHYEYELELSSVRKDTLQGITTVIDSGPCCAAYELAFVYINGEIVCFEDCGEVVEVEI